MCYLKTKTKLHFIVGNENTRALAKLSHLWHRIPNGNSFTNTNSLLSVVVVSGTGLRVGFKLGDNEGGDVGNSVGIADVKAGGRTQTCT